MYQPPVTVKPGVSFFNQTDNARSSSSNGSPLPQADIGLPLTPYTGQHMRLRGGAGPWEGYLEVRAAKDRPWGHVCDSSDSWTLQEANVVCRHLGYLR